MVGVMECFRMAMYTYKAPPYHALQFLHHIATAVTDSSCSAPYKHAHPERPPQGLCTPASTECICLYSSLSSSDFGPSRGPAIEAKQAIMPWATERGATSAYDCRGQGEGRR